MSTPPSSFESVRLYSHPAHRQDRWVIHDVFKGMRDGFFIDCGAGPDGISNSNSYALETQFGWKGLCIEAHPERYESMQANRKCPIENVCVTDRATEVEFTLNHERPGTSGIVDFMHEASRENDYREGEHYQTIKIPGVPLVELLRKHDAPKRIDYMSMDIEGAEYVALRDFPFDEYTFSAMTIERNSKDYLSLRKMLLGKGYKLAMNYCADDFYYHESLDYQPELSTRIETALRKLAQDLFEREPALTLRRAARRMGIHRSK